jgi:ATP-binding cassette subfamily B protein
MEQDVADFEKGVETQVGTRGVRLSGGQAQRAAAARAYAQDAELLVFDDLSSALDVMTERALWERWDALRASGGGSRTALAVSHRRAALKRADRVLVLKDGRVEDSGTLDDLLARCDEMRQIWNAQDAGEE